jgi:uncharacterized protein
MERRFFDTNVKIETRGEDAAAKQVIRGYGAVFDRLSENLGGFREKIAVGAFDDVLNDDVRALFNHDANHILGRTKAGTLHLFVDEAGLGYEIDTPDTQTGRDLVTSMKRGDVSQSSFGFTVDDDEWSEDEEGRTVRTIKKVSRLFDVSPVTYPAYPDASAAVRSLEAWKEANKSNEPGHSMREREVELAEAF